MTDLANLLETARQTLHANDRGGYTVPTHRLYPFQWNWDSAFVAMGWATFDKPRAWAEMEFLLKGQWDDGLVPHIIFHAPSDDYFPGPDVWGTRHKPPTSGIPQPPVLATATRAVLRADPAGSDRAEAMFPRLLANHRWWERARDPQRTGVVATLHPWETGMDNSPAWDVAMARVPTTTTTVIRRRDTSHIDPSMRPRADDYQRFIHLVDTYRDASWDPARMIAAAPFRMADPGTNAILLRAERDLLALAERFGTPAERGEITARIDRLSAGIESLWHAPSGIYRSRDLISGALADVSTSAGFLPLHAGVVAHAGALAGTLADWAGRVRWTVPSTDPSDPRFEPLRYWRGPVWAVVNWMIAGGLRAAGEAALAERVEADTRGLLDTAGLSEYFDPTTGAGIGGATFSWSAAIRLLLA